MNQRPLVQIALDTTSINEALRLGTAALAAGADWLEIGKPLVEFEGINGAREVAKTFAGHYLLLDLMIMASPQRYVDAAAEIGIANVTVTALAPDATVAAAIEAGRQTGVDVTVDLFNAADVTQRAEEVLALGATHLMVHFGIDQKRERPNGSPIADLAAITRRTTVPVSYATYDATESRAAVQAGAAVIVQGHPLLDVADPETELRSFIEATRAAAGPQGGTTQ